MGVAFLLRNVNAGVPLRRIQQVSELPSDLLGKQNNLLQWKIHVCKVTHFYVLWSTNSTSPWVGFHYSHSIPAPWLAGLCPPSQFDWFFSASEPTFDQLHVWSINNAIIFCFHALCYIPLLHPPTHCGLMATQSTLAQHQGHPWYKLASTMHFSYYYHIINIPIME